MGFIWSVLDESSDRLQRKAFVVAGYLARQAAWADIERFWSRRLEQESDPRPKRNGPGRRSGNASRHGTARERERQQHVNGN